VRVIAWLLSLLLLAAPSQGNGVDPPSAADEADALLQAAYEDDEARVAALLAGGAKAGAANDLGITALHLAAVNGNAAIAARLITAGADPGARSEAGVTPLMEAARAGSLEVARLLIARGADVNVHEPGRGQTALMWAVSRRHPAIVRALLEAGANVHAQTKTRPLTVMLDRGPSRTVKTSMQDAAQIQAGGSTALLFAATSGDVTAAALLLAAGANVDDAAADGNSALTLAAFSGHGSVARALIEAGANVNAAGAGYAPLHAAVLRGDRATVEALVAKGADVNARITRGSPVRRFGSQWALPTPFIGATPLMVAAVYLEVDILRALLARGADPSLPVTGGTTPLMAAAGADVQAEARPSDLARWHVVDNDSPDVPRDPRDALAAAALLLDAGADVNQSIEAGDTALHVAAGAGLVPLIQLLADRGAQLDAVNQAGQTPLSLTLPRAPQPGRGGGAPGRPEAEALLRKLGAR
jgi:ankyrin repeat domain-containing protein 17